MVKRIEVEKSEFVNSVINTYSSNRVGQYSKFLERNPIFVIYLSVNEIRSTADFATGNIDNVYGNQSPIRYNRINGLPMYNFPEMKPDFDISEDYGADITLDLSGLTLAPGTIHPNPYDSFIVVYPRAGQLLFRVNQFEFNSIQSNDFYICSAHLVAKGEDILNELNINYQIVETYETIFENIGTQNACFIESSKVGEINNLASVIETLRDNYMAKFYDDLTNSFILRNNIQDKKEIVEYELPPEVDGAPISHARRIEVTHQMIPYALYDPYLEYFISSTHLFETGDANFTMCLEPKDIIPIDFKHMYQKSIWRMLQEKTRALTSDYMYFYMKEVQKFGSPFVVYGMAVATVQLIEKGYDMYSIDDPVKKERLAAIEKLDSTYNFYREEDYLTEDWNTLTLLHIRAGAGIYATEDVHSIHEIVKNAEDDMSKVLTKKARTAATYIEKIVHHRAHIDMSQYTEKAQKEIISIGTTYIKAIRNAPEEVHESLYHRYREDVLEVKRIGEEETEDGTESMLS